MLFVKQAQRPPAASMCLGQWQAWVESGTTLEERRARLSEVPEELREQVKGHLRTVWGLKRKKSLTVTRNAV